MRAYQRIVIRSIGFLFIFLVFSGQVASAREKVGLRVGYLPLLSQLPVVVSYENDRLGFDKI